MVTSPSSAITEATTTAAFTEELQDQSVTNQVVTTLVVTVVMVHLVTELMDLLAITLLDTDSLDKSGKIFTSDL